MAKRRLNIPFAVACEHVVQGEGNKPTLIGVFLSDILVPSFPTAFWVSFFVQVESLRSLPKDLRITVRLNDAEVGAMDIQLTGVDLDNSLFISVPAGLINVAEPTKLSLYVGAEGFSDAEVILKSIKINPQLR